MKDVRYAVMANINETRKYLDRLVNYGLGINGGITIATEVRSVRHSVWTEYTFEYMKLKTL